MAGMGPAPNPNKRRRNASTFDWVELPRAGRQGPPPPLPPGKWPKVCVDEWVRLWATPQATQWDQTGRSLYGYLDLVRRVHQPGTMGVPGHYAEMRQVEDRHGLNPKALLQLRWRIVDEAGAVGEDEPVSDASGSVVSLDRRRRGA